MTPVRQSGWRSLSTTDRRTLLVLAMLQPLISASLRMAGYANTKRHLQWLSRHPRHRKADAADLEQARYLARLAGMAGRNGPIQTTCLRQALALYFLLRRKGLDPSIKFGVAHPAGHPEMHAWVELDGSPLDPTANAYALFAPTTG